MEQSLISTEPEGCSSHHLADGLLNRGECAPSYGEVFVKRRVELFPYAATIAIVIALTVWAMSSRSSTVQAQQTSPNTQQAPQQPPQSQPPDTEAPAPNQPAQGQAPAQAQQSNSAADGHEFVGTIQKQGTKYVFQDAASGQTYDIDHQDEVRKFDGKKVRVRGTLDEQTKTIHVE